MKKETKEEIFTNTAYLLLFVSLFTILFFSCFLYQEYLDTKETNSCTFVTEEDMFIFKETNMKFFSDQKSHYDEFPRLLELAQNESDDEIIKDLTAYVLKDVSQDDDEKKIYAILKFVSNSVDYSKDNESTEFQDYWKYPLETIYDKTGDCEDTSVLAYALLKEAGYDVSILVFDTHVTIGIAEPEGVTFRGQYFEKNEVKYYRAETDKFHQIGFVEKQFEKDEPIGILI